MDFPPKRLAHNGLIEVILLLANVYFFWVVFFSCQAFGQTKNLSEEEFRSLANDLASKVNLFQDAWNIDPEAVFYGGTTRDYLYWLKGKFRDTNSKEEAKLVAQKLRGLPIIDVREFIIGESDIDIVSERKLALQGSQYGVQKIDSISNTIFDATTPLGHNELWQGHLPAEKIRLGKGGISQAKDLGDGLHEIYTGKLSIHFSDPVKFQETLYAKNGINHPILLALRYLRLQGINYYQSHGKGYPDPALLLEGMEPKYIQEVQKVIQSTLNGKELLPYLKSIKFRSWINGNIQKSFRSYTNPTAALNILKHFDVDQLSSMYGLDSNGKSYIEPIYQYVFSKFRDEKLIGQRLKEFNVNQSEFYRSVESLFPDSFFYHGTKTESAFRSIQFQGVLPSEVKSSAGAGLYGVAVENKKFAEDWGEDKTRLLKLPVDKDAKIVDINKNSEGLRVWKEYSRKYGENFETFADDFGIDILKYKYNTDAFVVKNSDKLGKAQGVYRQLMTVGEFLAKVEGFADADHLLSNILINQLSRREMDLVLKEVKFSEEEMAEAIIKHVRQAPELLFNVFGHTDIWKNNIEKILIAYVKNNEFKEVASIFPTFLRSNSPRKQEVIEALVENVTREKKVYKPIKEVLLKNVFNEPNGKLVPLFRKFISSSLDPAYERDIPSIILEKWSDFPEVLEAFLGYHNRNVIQDLIFKKGFLVNPLWMEKYDLMAKFLRKFILSAQGNDLSIFSQIGWQNDLSAIQKISKMQHFNGGEEIFNSLISRLLSRNGLWKQDPDLFIKAIKGIGFHNVSVATILADPELYRYPKIMETIILHADRLVGIEKSNQLVRILSKPEWTEHGKFVELFLRAEIEMGVNLAQAKIILSSPAWQNHPELLEEYVIRAFSFYSSGSGMIEKEISELLDLPHWRNHPHFSPYLENGQISLKKLRRGIVQSHPEYRTITDRVAIACEGFFTVLLRK